MRSGQSQSPMRRSRALAPSRAASRYTNIYIYIYIYMHMCPSVYTHTHTHTHLGASVFEWGGVGGCVSVVVGVGVVCVLAAAAAPGAVGVVGGSVVVGVAAVVAVVAVAAYVLLWVGSRGSNHPTCHQLQSSHVTSTSCLRVRAFMSVASSLRITLHACVHCNVHCMHPWAQTASLHSPASRTRI